MLTWTPRSRWWCPRRCAAGTPPSWRSARPRWRRTGHPIRCQHYPPTNHSSPCTRSSARTPPPPPPWPCRGRACPRRPCPWTAPCPSSTLDHNDGADNWQWSNPLLLQLGAAVSGVVQQLQTVESLCLVRSGLGRAAEVTLGWCRQQELVMSMVVAGVDMYWGK